MIGVANDKDAVLGCLENKLRYDGPDIGLASAGWALNERDTFGQSEPKSGALAIVRKYIDLVHGVCIFSGIHF